MVERMGKLLAKSWRKLPPIRNFPSWVGKPEGLDKPSSKIRSGNRGGGGGGGQLIRFFLTQ